jgi:ABC-type phosphate transport system substrate-binding protein
MKNQKIVLRTGLVAALLLWALGSPAPAGEGAYRIVVNPANPATALQRAELARLFMRKASAWPDGTPAAAVDQPRTAPVRSAFSRDVHNKDVDSVVAYWSTMVYAGREMPPPVRKSDQEVLDFVRQTPGAVGYVSADAEVAGVKVIALR